MKHLSQSILFFAICLLATFQLSAQCSNINSSSTKDRLNPNTHVFGNMSFGQSIAGSCFSGNHITKFSFWSQGNSSTKMDLKIFEGNSQTVSGTPIYTQSSVQLPPANFGGKLTIELDRAVPTQSSKTYTFVMTLASSGGGNLIAHVSDDKYSGGQLYLKKEAANGFNSKYDLRFEVETESAGNECGGIKLTQLPTLSNGNMQVEIDATNYPHQLSHPAYSGGSQFEIINGTCEGCKSFKGTTGIWTIKPSGTPVLKFTRFSGPDCNGKTFSLK